MKRKKLFLIGVPVLTVVCCLALALGYIARCYQAAQLPPDPQHEAFLQLQADSEVPADFYFENGFPRFVHGRVAVKGDNAVERAQNFLQTYHDLYLQDSSNLNLLVRRTTEELGLESVTFYQTYKGIPVYGGEIVVSLDGEWVYATVGGILTSKVDLDVTPAISDRDAETIARTEPGMAEAPILGVTNLIVFDFSLIEDVALDPRLAWQVSLGGRDPRKIIVDAHSGAVVSSNSTTFNAYELMLVDENGATTSDCFNDTDDDLWIGTEEVLMSGYQSDPDAVAAWNFSRDVYDFFTAFNLDSYDDNGAAVRIHIHASEGARWSVECGLILLPDGSVGWDVVVHEYSHAILYHSSNLSYIGQGASLHESFADAMAMMADPDDWLLGDNTTGNFNPVRDLSNDPINHMDLKWPDKNFYTNMGIPNTAIYLMSDGGTVNDLTITGIGRIKMAWLYFAALRSLGSGAQFIDARNHIVATAEEWAQDGYAGFTDNDLCQVRNAYYAVGLGHPDLDCDGNEDLFNADPDGDHSSLLLDNCLDAWNPGQEDIDKDSIGDACDPDIDGDGVLQGSYDLRKGQLSDNCPLDENPKEEIPPGSGIFIQPDIDKDGKGDACDLNTDSDDFSDDDDNCDFTDNPDQTDTDNDSIGDACDKCPTTKDTVIWTASKESQPMQPDSDGDGIPDACDWRYISLHYSIPWGVAVGDITLNGEEHAAAVIGDPATSLLLPMPICPPDQGSGFSPDYRELLLLHGLDSSVSARLVDGAGNVAGQPRINGSRYLSFAPRGGEPYYLRLGFGPQYQAGQTASFTFSLVCGPKDLLPPPPSEVEGIPTPTLLEPFPIPDTPTPEPKACTLTALVNLFCRPAPGYESIDEFTAGQSAAVVAQSDFLWQVIGLKSGLLCTVPKDAAFVRTDGDCGTVPGFTPLLPPTPTETPTLEPVQGCTVRQAGGAIICVVPCPASAAPGEACTP